MAKSIAEPIIKEYFAKLNSTFKELGVEDVKIKYTIKQGTNDSVEPTDEEFPVIGFDIVIGEELGSEDEDDVINYLNAEIGNMVLTLASYWILNERPADALSILADEGIKAAEIIEKVIKNELKHDGIDL